MIHWGHLVAAGCIRRAGRPGLEEQQWPSHADLMLFAVRLVLLSDALKQMLIKPPVWGSNLQINETQQCTEWVLMRVYSDDTGSSLACNFLVIYVSWSRHLVSIRPWAFVLGDSGIFILVRVWKIVSAKAVLSCIWPGLQIWDLCLLKLLL